MRTRLVVNTGSWIASLRRRAAFNTSCRRPLSNGRGFLSDLEESVLGSLKPTITFRPDDIIGHGRGLRPTLPSNAMDSLLERLERAHYCSTLRQQGPTRAGESSSTQQRSDESLLLEHWGFALRRYPPHRLSGAKQQQQQRQGGLYLTKGVVPQGSVITLYPGLLYQIPYDLEGLMNVEDPMLGLLLPPDFLRNNRYILRFHDHENNQHVLVDGNPSGRSAINFIKASMRRAGLQANLDWLESGLKEGSSSTEQAGLSDAESALLPPGIDHGYHTSRYFSLHLGMGHLIRDVSRCADADSLQNVDFHLCAIKDLPRHLARYLPNVPYSGLLSGGDDSLHYTVLVTAATDLEANEEAPVELLVGGLQHRHGYPLR